jgi:uncharacterized protein
VPKPIDHPEFFRLPPPPGASRESSIRLDRDGTFWHDGERVQHPAMHRAFASWLTRHPDDGRYILTNGYDWTYLLVEDTPYFVEALRADRDRPYLVLSDGSEQPLEADALSMDEDGILYIRVKGGQYEARFSPAAQLQLAPWVVDAGERAALAIDGPVVEIPLRVSDPNSCSG